MIIAIDPGLKPGAVLLALDGKVLRASHRLEDWVFREWDLAVTEGQWYHTGGKASPTSLLTLAFRAGFTLASIPAQRRLRIPPKVWRGSSAASKAVVQSRIARTLSPEEKELFKNIPKSRHGDVLDAVGIGRAALRLAPTTTEYDFSLEK